DVQCEVRRPRPMQTVTLDDEIVCQGLLALDELLLARQGLVVLANDDLGDADTLQRHHLLAVQHPHVDEHAVTQVLAEPVEGDGLHAALRWNSCRSAYTSTLLP